MSNYPQPHVEPASRPEMIIVFMFFTLWGFSLGLGVGWWVWG